MAVTPEASDFTSIQERIQVLQKEPEKAQQRGHGGNGGHGGSGSTGHGNDGRDGYRA
jgi:hypothetical protein